MKRIGVVYNWDTSISEEDQEQNDIIMDALVSKKHIDIMKDAADEGTSLYRFLENVEKGYEPTLNDLRWHQKDCELRIIGIK